MLGSRKYFFFWLWRQLRLRFQLHFCGPYNGVLSYVNWCNRDFFFIKFQNFFKVFDKILKTVRIRTRSRSRNSKSRLRLHRGNLNYGSATLVKETVKYGSSASDSATLVKWTVSWAKNYGIFWYIKNMCLSRMTNLLSSRNVTLFIFLLLTVFVLLSDFPAENAGMQTNTTGPVHVPRKQSRKTINQ